MKKFLILLITLIAVVATIVFQTVFINEIPLFGVIANIGIVFISTIALTNDEKTGAIIGVLYGLFSDVMFGRTFGIYTIAYFILGYTIGYLKGRISLENRLTAIIVVAISTILFEAFFMIIGIVLYKYSNVQIGKFIKIIICETLYNLFLTFVFYYPFSWIGNLLNDTKKRYIF